VSMISCIRLMLHSARAVTVLPEHRWAAMFIRLIVKGKDGLKTLISLQYVAQSSSILGEKHCSHLRTLVLGHDFAVPVMGTGSHMCTIS